MGQRGGSGGKSSSKSTSSKGKSSKGKGKGKGSSGGHWAWVPVKTEFRSKGKSKGGKKGGKGKRKREVTPFAELSDERKEEIRAKHQEVHEEQGREEVGDEFYTGELLQRRKNYGWVKPSAFSKLPAEVQKKVKEMVKAKRASVKEHGSENEVFKQMVLFVHMSDVEEGTKVSPGDKVKFQVYVDNEGAGAREVTLA